jgi:hypothetical protein
MKKFQLIKEHIMMMTTLHGMSTTDPQVKNLCCDKNIDGHNMTAVMQMTERLLLSNSTHRQRSVCNLASQVYSYIYSYNYDMMNSMNKQVNSTERPTITMWAILKYK